MSSLRMAVFFCVLIVLILRFNCAAISVIVMPDTNKRTTSSSRFDNTTSRCWPLADKPMLSSARRTDGLIYLSSHHMNDGQSNVAQIVRLIDNGRTTHFTHAYHSPRI